METQGVQQAAPFVGGFRREWQAEEVLAALRGKSIREAARALGRTENSVGSKATALGLSRGGWCRVDVNGPAGGPRYKVTAHPDAATIKCLRCPEEFWSPSKKRIRLCPTCRQIPTTPWDM